MKPRSIATLALDPNATAPDPASGAAVLRSTPGDVQSLTVDDVFRSHGDFVWASLQRLGIRAPDLDDVFQETFIVIHNRLGSFEGRSRLSTWLFGICIRTAAAHRRRAYVRRERVGALDVESEPHAGESPDLAMEQNQRQHVLDAILDQMDLTRRAVFVMFEIDEIPCDEIATVLDVPVGTVYSRLAAARKEFAALHARYRARVRHSGGSR